MAETRISTLYEAEKSERELIRRVLQSDCERVGNLILGDGSVYFGGISGGAPSGYGVAVTVDGDRFEGGSYGASDAYDEPYYSEADVTERSDLSFTENGGTWDMYEDPYEDPNDEESDDSGSSGSGAGHSSLFFGLCIAFIILASAAAIWIIKTTGEDESTGPSFGGIPVTTTRASSAPATTEPEAAVVTENTTSSEALTFSAPYTPVSEYTMYAYQATNIRTGPGTEYALSGLIDDGASVRVVGFSGDWLAVECDGMAGFVLDGMLSSQESERGEKVKDMDYVTDSGETIVYSGYISNGEPNGEGVGKWKNGSEYDGGWKDGVPDGEGTMTYPLGSSYYGHWEKGKKHGKGIMTYYNGDEYVGSWENDYENGFGTMIYKNEDKYEGKWYNGKKHGNGTMTYANGDLYEGEWSYNSRSGNGKMTYANGNVYEGGWNANLRSGEGVMSYAVNGSGNMTYAAGGEYVGDWENDVRSGIGTMMYENGNYYSGQFKNDDFNGSGRYYWASGFTYDGEWKDGDRSGYGTLTSPEWSGEVEYVGQWENGRRNGQGTQTYTNGKVKSGTWKDDEFVG